MLDRRRIHSNMEKRPRPVSGAACKANSVLRQPDFESWHGSASAAAVVVVPIAASKVILTPVIDVMRPAITHVAYAKGRIDEGRTSVVDRRRLIVAVAVISGHGLKARIVVTIGAGSDACTGQCADGTADHGTVTTVHVVPDCRSDAGSDEGAEQRIIGIGLRRKRGDSHGCRED